MKVTRIENSDGKFEKNTRKKIKFFLNLSKFNIIPSILTGAYISLNSFMPITSNQTTDVLLFGGVAGLAFILAINGVITKIRYSKEDRERLKMLLDEVDENDLKSIDDKGKKDERIRK